MEGFVFIDFRVSNETEKAYLFKRNGIHLWIPKSICRVFGKSLKIPMWFAKKNKECFFSN